MSGEQEPTASPLRVGDRVSFIVDHGPIQFGDVIGVSNAPYAYRLRLDGGREALAFANEVRKCMLTREEEQAWEDLD